ncbi:hypothetical protein POL68_03815 [Stigmatella sp. ncwal1]|uniref:Uncharacterized protein n=1 Tax=Stigmatella ashevillensis TaxID=2995309 RepID=A0ABT5D1Q3_9BACT|nr:hypothetical protein [Stigmatella ashevillena]MDC0707588.1 hypothetical protein [Stigmatella ashevillena]
MQMTALLEQLGLKVETLEGGVQATLTLAPQVAPENPVTHQRLSYVTFQVSEERLTPVAPPSVVGLPPIAVGSLKNAEELALLVRELFEEHLFHVERRSAQLNALGLHPIVDPETLELSAELESGPLLFTVVADRQGFFRVGKVLRQGAPLESSAVHRFELSEFRERNVLAGYLAALFDEPPARPPPGPLSTRGLVRFSEVAERFGTQAIVPPRSQLELLVQMSVNGESYRFAAARLVGRTFRGLLAGSKGKVWAERFELDDFPGIVPLVASLLKVPPEAVKLIGPDTPQE